MAAAIKECTITACTGLIFLFISFFSCFFTSLNVKLSHDATCVPSTCSDNDGHPECSSTIVPGEPTGQRSNHSLSHCLTCNSSARRTMLMNVKNPENQTAQFRIVSWLSKSSDCCAVLTSWCVVSWVAVVVSSYNWLTTGGHALRDLSPPGETQAWYVWSPNYIWSLKKHTWDTCHPVHRMTNQAGGGETVLWTTHHSCIELVNHRYYPQLCPWLCNNFFITQD